MKKTIAEVDVKKQCVIEGGLKLVEEGLITRTWGNVSSRISNDAFVITPSGLPYKSLTLQNIVKINMHDLSYTGTVKPSSETQMHAQIYKAKPEVNFVMHTHQLAATTLSIFPDGVDLTKHNLENALPEFPNGLVPISKYAPSGTQELADYVCQKAMLLGNKGCVLMAHHGVLFFGANLDDCFEIALRVEKVCLSIINRISRGRLPIEYSRKNESITKMECRQNKHSEFADNIFEANPDYDFLAYSERPHIRGLSILPNRNFKIPVFVDDFAQIAGVHCTFLKDNYNFAKNNMAMWQGHGCIAIGKTQDDVEAISEITDKNAMICLFSEYVMDSRPMTIADVNATRIDYLSGYSKLATSKD